MEKNQIKKHRRDSLLNLNYEKLKENYSLNKSKIENLNANKFDSSITIENFLRKEENEINTFLQNKDEIKNYFKNEIKNEKNEEEKQKNQIFWEKNKIKDFWNKIKKIKSKIEKKKRLDYQNLIKNILNEKEDFAYKKLTSKKFLKFYKDKDNLFPEKNFIEFLIENNKYNLILKLINHKEYNFDYDYIFKNFLNILESDNKNILTSNSNNINNETNINNNLISIKNSQKTNLNPKNEDEEIYIDNEYSLTKENKNNNLIKSKKEKSIEIIVNLIEFQLYDENNEDKIKIIAYLLALLGFNDSFKKFVSDNKIYLTEEAIQYNNFLNENDIVNFSIDKVQFQLCVENCLKCDLEDLAIFLVEFLEDEINFEYENDDYYLPKIAAETENLKFLKFIWEKDKKNEDNNNNNEKSNINLLNFRKNIKEKFSYKKRKKNINKNKTYLNKNKLLNIFQIEKFKPNFNINDIIKILVENDKKQFCKNKSIFNINEITKWKNIMKDETFLSSLFNNNCFETLCLLIEKWPNEFFLNKNYFKISIEKQQKELILFFLKFRECREILIENSIQKFIVDNYLDNGEFLYYGSELLSYIYPNNWNIEITKDLCKNVTKCIKKKEILNCHSPILSCLLLVEFTKKIKSIDIGDMTRCEKLIEILIDFCKNIQDSNHNENLIGYFMKQKDTRDRTVFQIVSEGNYYNLLETSEIGIIIKKMWNGNLSDNSFFSASSMHRFLFNNNEILDPFESFDKLNVNKIYFFQLVVWLDSCNLRFNVMGFYSIFLTLVYNYMIYFMNSNGELLNNFQEMSTNAKNFLIIYLIMVNLLIFDIINQIFYICLSKREFQLEIWTYLDLFLFIFAWLLIVDTKEITGEYKDYEIVEGAKDILWSIQLPFLKELKAEDPTFSTHMSFWFREFILMINNILVWCRLAGFLLTNKTMGPVIRMIFAMTKLLIKYIIIIVIFLACCAGFFTAIFNRKSTQFKDFSTSVVTLFGGFLNTFDCYKFDDSSFYFGSVILLIYVCIAAVLFVNILIAILSNVFEDLMKSVDASHRAVIIHYYKKYRWDDEYGYLIFLSLPFNLLNVPFFLINKIFYVRNQKYFNLICTKIFYFFCYFPFIEIFLCLYNFLLIFICYIKGVFLMIKFVNSYKILPIRKFLLIFNWFFFGIFFLIFISLRDIYYNFSYVFQEFEAKDDEFQRIRKNMTNDDIRIFLKFIHSDKAKNGKTVYELFMDYLDYENKEKIQNNQFNSNKSSLYLTKITKNLGEKSIIFYNNLNYNNSNNYSFYIRKNLMVIEILENFVLDEEQFQNAFVNLDKLKKILPKVINIKNHHLRRLIYSDERTLISAMSKINTNKIFFIQYQIINKLILTARRLDKDLDSEIFKIKRFIEHCEKLNKNYQKKNKIFLNDENYDYNINIKFLNEKNEEIYNLIEYLNILKRIKLDVHKIIDKKNIIIKNELKESEIKIKTNLISIKSSIISNNNNINNNN